MPGAWPRTRSGCRRSRRARAAGAGPPPRHSTSSRGQRKRTSWPSCHLPRISGIYNPSRSSRTVLPCCPHGRTCRMRSCAVCAGPGAGARPGAPRRWSGASLPPAPIWRRQGRPPPHRATSPSLISPKRAQPRSTAIVRTGSPSDSEALSESQSPSFFFFFFLSFFFQL
eukprot:COSAG05_NODE_107_length_18696_cov_209.227766_15_plen_169_part_00